MRRREFLALFGGAAACPLIARAQSGPVRVRRVGVLMGGAEGDTLQQRGIAALKESLGKLGWTEGRNIEFDIRYAGADGVRRMTYAAEIVSRAPDVIVSSTAPVARALQQETTTIPIVMASGADIVSEGVITNLARPAGNITGFPATEFSLGGKWFDLLKGLVPGATHLAIVENPETVNSAYVSAVERAAQGRILQMTAIVSHDDAQIERGVAGLSNAPDGALLVLPGASNLFHRGAIVAAAARHRIPAIYPFREYVESGGLMSYGADLIDLFHRAAAYVDRILHGETTANLPVQFPTKFELMLNLKAAKAIGLEIPHEVLLIADEVIE
jgi:putative tryptophan/tyrosine transport system substrate-binding protein